MNYIISGDLENLFITVTDDPRIADRQFSVGWSKAELEVLTGIIIPPDVEALSIEPGRNIFAIRLVGEEGQIFKSANDHPVLKALWDNNYILRRHTQAKFLEANTQGYYKYNYDPQEDEIVQTEDPLKDHKEATVELSSTKIGCRVIIDLVDLLLAKGILHQSDLPDYFITNKANVKSIVDRIDWDLMQGN
jgi:hypothetical protein